MAAGITPKSQPLLHEFQHPGEMHLGDFCTAEANFRLRICVLVTETVLRIRPFKDSRRK